MLQVSSLFPPLSWLPAYKRLLQNQGTEADQQAVGDLAYSAKGDFVAGLTVGLMLVPQCLAFALLAGLHVRAGHENLVESPQNRASLKPEEACEHIKRKLLTPLKLNKMK